jgi:Ser/Thr protein kinase RdoA (MazF antagonist)
MTTSSAWGGDTQFFFSLTPERVLDAVETAGLGCTGRCQALNSFENRVYDVELERQDGSPLPLGRQEDGSRRVAKFYRPGRWTREQILEEHRFLLDLNEAEVPAVAPIALPGGETLAATPEGIFFALFPKVGGRSPDEFSDDDCLRIGRQLARVHQVGAARTAPPSRLPRC